MRPRFCWNLEQEIGWETVRRRRVPGSEIDGTCMVEEMVVVLATKPGLLGWYFAQVAWQSILRPEERAGVVLKYNSRDLALRLNRVVKVHPTRVLPWPASAGCDQESRREESVSKYTYIVQTDGAPGTPYGDGERR